MTVISSQITVRAKYLAKAALQAHGLVYQLLPLLVGFADFLNYKVLDLGEAAYVCGKERTILHVGVHGRFIRSHAETVGVEDMRV
jgi:hypothetical protein